MKLVVLDETQGKRKLFLNISVILGQYRCERFPPARYAPVKLVVGGTGTREKDAFSKVPTTPFLAKNHSAWTLLT